MNIGEIRAEFHQLIDEIDNGPLLNQFYEVLNGLRRSNVDVDFWDQLTDEQKRDLDEAWEESERGEGFISNEQVMMEARQWVKE
jgi:hypothetical protein